MGAQPSSPSSSNGEDRPQLRPSDVDSVCVCIIMPGLPAGIGADTFVLLHEAEALFRQLGVDFSVCPVQGLSYEHALAETCAQAMQQTTAKRLFFLDTDMAFDARWIAMMCAADRDIICGTYQQRTSQGEWCINTTDRGVFEGAIVWEPKIRQRLVPINDTGFGAVCVRREVIERLQRLHHSDEPGKGLNYRSMNPLVEHEAYALWDPWIFLHGGIRRRCAGDTNFFKRARDAGYQPWALLDMEINHARLGLKSLGQWVAQQQAEAAVTLERLKSNEPACSKCGGVPAPFAMVDELHTQHGARRLCASCAQFLPTDRVKRVKGRGCDRCGAAEAPYLAEGDGTPGSDAHLCQACASA